MTDNHKAKIGKANKKKMLKLWQNPEYRKHMSEVHKGNEGYWVGKKRSEKTINKIRIKKKGKRCSSKTEFKKGFTPWNKGKHPEYMQRENHPNWRGGIGKLPYPFDFNEELKELIRKRDNYKCQKCGCPQEECYRKLDVHHKDGDKNNLNPNNLISFCQSCHIKLEAKKSKNMRDL